MQQQQSTMPTMKPSKIGNAGKKVMKPSDFPGMDSKYYNSPAMNKKYGDKPKKTPVKKSSKKSTPSKMKVMSSLRKTMGYK